MNTVEVTVEQVLAGIIGLVVCVLPFVQPAAVAEASKTFTVALVGVAYLVGAVLDKLFDTVVGGAEQWLRLRVAIERHSKTGGPSAQSTPNTDPFDQGRLEAELRKAEGAATWMNYLRTRIRLTRTLGVTAPLIGLAVSTSILFAECRLTRGWGTVMQLPQGWCSWILAVLPPLILGIAASFAQFSRLPKTNDWNYDCSSKTEGGASSTQSRRWKWKRNGLSFEAQSHAPPSRSFTCWTFLAWRPVLCVYVGAWMSGAIIASWSNRSFPFVMAIAGSAIGGLSLWAWHRILQSYMAFIANWFDINRSSSLHSRNPHWGVRRVLRRVDRRALFLRP